MERLRMKKEVCFERARRDTKADVQKPLVTTLASLKQTTRRKRGKEGEEKKKHLLDDSV